MHYETLFQDIRKAQMGKCLKNGAEWNVALKDLWPDVGRFAEGDEYKRLEVGIFKLEIV